MSRHIQVRAIVIELWNTKVALNKWKRVRLGNPPASEFRKQSIKHQLSQFARPAFPRFILIRKQLKIRLGALRLCQSGDSNPGIDTLSKDLTLP